MSIWNKILLVLIALASLGFFHAAARTVKTYQYWADQTDQFEKKLKERNDEIVSLQTADHEDSSRTRQDDRRSAVAHRFRPRVGQPRPHLDEVREEEGRLDPDPKNPGIMLVTVSTEDSAPNPFTDKMLLYAFEEGDDQSPGKYLGEFRVKLPSDKQIVLASTTQMSGRPIRRSNSSPTT